MVEVTKVLLNAKTQGTLVGIEYGNDKYLTGYIQEIDFDHGLFVFREGGDYTKNEGRISVWNLNAVSRIVIDAPGRPKARAVAKPF